MLLVAEFEVSGPKPAAATTETGSHRHHMGDYLEYLRYIGALGLVLVLIFALAWSLRRYGNQNLSGGRGRREKRLSVLEVLPIDPRRRLVLIGHDDREHLLLLGHERDLLIASGPAFAPASAINDSQMERATGSGAADPGGMAAHEPTTRYMPASRPGPYDN